MNKTLETAINTMLIRQNDRPARKARTYFTLAQSDDSGKTWFPDFGDYDRETVAQEISDRKESYGHTKATRYKIVKSNETQASINAAIAKLNAA